MRTSSEPRSSRTPFRGLRAFTVCELRVQLHEELAVATSMLTQAVLLTFVWILAPGLFGVALVGAILFSAFTLGQRVLNESAYIRIDHKLNEMFLASPLSPEAYFLGTALGILGAYLAPILVLGGIAVAVLHPSLLAAAVLIGATALLWLFASSMGYILSTLFRDQRAIWSWSGLLYSLFGVLPPVFYPLADFPAPLRPLALALPPSGAAALVEDALHPGTLSTVEIAFTAGGLIGLSLAMLALGILWSRRSVRER